MKNLVPRERIFTQKDLWARWSKSYSETLHPRTVRRHIKQFKLRAFRRRGVQPLYLESAVKAMEDRRQRFMDSLLNGLDDRDGGAGIISVATAKKRANGKARK